MRTKSRDLSLKIELSIMEAQQDIRIRPLDYQPYHFQMRRAMRLILGSV